MKYCGVIFIFALSALACSAEVITDMVSFRGWNHCIRMRDGVATVILNPEYGGHIIYYGLDRIGKNVLWADSIVNGWGIEEFIPTRRSPDSGRFDIGNERKTENIHDTIWAGPYTPSVFKEGVSMESLPSEKMGIRLRREYKLKAGKVTVTQYLTNISDQPLEYCFWTRTLLPSGGIYMAKAQISERYPSGFAEICLKSDSLLNNIETDRITCRFSWFCAYPGGVGEHKYGINTEDGVSYYYCSPYLYKKTTQIVSLSHEMEPISLSDSKVIARTNDSAFPIRYENNAGQAFPNMVYFCEDFIEMEPNSPLYRIPPGKTAVWEEVWQLFPI